LTHKFVLALERYFSSEITEISVLLHTEGEELNKYEKNGKVQDFNLKNSDFISIVPPMNADALAQEITKIFASMEYRTSLVRK
jgi:hypothetical protein